MSDARVSKAIARFDDIAARLDTRDGAVRDAARRERQRLNAGLGRTAMRIGMAVAIVALATVVIGVINPIGIFGLLAAILIGLVLAGGIIAASRKPALTATPVAPDLPNAAMVDRFDSFLFRSRPALPAPAQVEIDALSAALPPLRETLGRVPDNDPAAQDARRLMSTYLPGLVERYQTIPSAYRSETDGEGKSVDVRLADSLRAGREALADVSSRLAKQDVAAFETQGRFIESRYKDEAID